MNMILLFLFGVIFSLEANSNFLDINELNNYKYKIDLVDLPVAVNDDLNEHQIELASIYGQQYVCNLKDVFEALNKSDDLANVSYNYTQIGLDIKENLGSLKNLNTCIYKNQGWWTYEYCFGKYLNQFHMIADNTIESPIIILGNFSGEFNWSIANDSYLLKDADNRFYHEEYYSNGSICDLTNEPRKVLLKLYCDEMTTQHIESIIELESCVYEIRVHTSVVCSVKGFNKKSERLSVSCNPSLNQKDYEKYLAIKIENEKINVDDEKIKDEINLDSIDLPDTPEELDKTNEILNKLSNTIDNLIDELSGSETNKGNDPLKIKVSVIDTKSDSTQKNDLSSDNLKKKLEDSLKEELSKKTNKKFDNIEVKVINIDGTQSTSDLSSILGDDSSSLKSILTRLFGGQQSLSQVKKLNSIYQTIYHNGQAINQKETKKIKENKDHDDDDELLILY